MKPKFLDCDKEHKTMRHVFYTFLALSFLFRMFYANKFCLTPDESSYWNHSQSLSLSYYGSDAIVGWAIRFFTDLLGHSEVAVRAASLILMTGTSIVFYNLAKKFISPVLAAWAVILLNITLIGGIIGILMIPDSFLLFFWCLTVYFLYKAIFEDKACFWCFAGITGGLGLWSGNIMVFGFLATFLFLVASKQYRFWLSRKEPYLAFFLFLIIISPITYWNYTHDWITYRNIFDLKKGIVLLALISPFIFIGILVSWVSIFTNWLKDKDSKKLFLLVFFGYILGVVSYFYALENVWRNRTNQKLKYLGYTFFAGIFSFLLLVIMLNPVLLYKIAYNMPGISPSIVEAVRNNRTNEINGWREYGEKIHTFRDNYLANEDVFFFALSYPIATELCFYYPKIHTYYFLSLEFEKLVGKTGIFVAENQDIEKIKPYFDSVELVYSFTVHRDDLKDEAIRTYYLYLCKNFKV